MPKDLLTRRSYSVALKAGFAAVAAVLVVGAVGELPLALALPLVLLAYGGAALLLGAVAPGELRALRALLPVPTSAAPTGKVTQPIQEEVT